MLGAITKEKRDYPSLDTSMITYRLNVGSISEIEDLAQYKQRVVDWASDVWTAWKPHHAQIEELTRSYMERFS